MNPIISDAWIYFEKDLTSPLVHPTIERAAVQLFVRKRDLRPKLGAYLHRFSFLLVAMDTHLQLLNLTVSDLVKAAPMMPPPGSKVVESGILGRSIHPTIAAINSLIGDAHSVMNFSVLVIGEAVGATNFTASINWAAATKGKPLIRKRGGEGVHGHVQAAWIWAERLKQYRDLFEHYNPLVATIPTYTSNTVGRYDGVRIWLPTNPEARKRGSQGFQYGIDALEYCTATRERVLKYANNLLLILAG
jgi:hypothetical protein